MDPADRFGVPLYSVPEAATYLGVPRSTFSAWVRGYGGEPSSAPPVRTAPLLTAMPPAAVCTATIPFISVAEGMMLAAIRRAGVALQRIRPALDRLRDTFGLEHVLASHSLYTDGAEVLYDFAERAGDTPEARSARELVVVRKGQHVFASVIDEYLQRVQFAGDGYAELIYLPRSGAADVVADPRRGFGQPIFSHGGAKLEDVLGAFHGRRVARGRRAGVRRPGRSARGRAPCRQPPRRLTATASVASRSRGCSGTQGTLGHHARRALRHPRGRASHGRDVARGDGSSRLDRGRQGRTDPAPSSREGGRAAVRLPCFYVTRGDLPAQT